MYTQAELRQTDGGMVLKKWKADPIVIMSRHSFELLLSV